MLSQNRADGSMPFPYDWPKIAPKLNPVSVSASCFLPTSLFSLRLTAWLARIAWFDGLEVLPFRGPVLRPIPAKIAIPILSGHGHFNPIPASQKASEAGVWAVFKDWFLLPSNPRCEKFLAQLHQQGVAISTYFAGDLEAKDHIYSSFQVYPGLPFDKTLELLQRTDAKVTYDLAHVRQTDREGQRTLPDWRESWEQLSPLVDNVHIQPLNHAELEAMWDGGKDTEITEMLGIIGASYKGPLTIEVDPLMMAGVLGVRALLPTVQIRYLSRFRQFVLRSLNKTNRNRGKGENGDARTTT